MRPSTVALLLGALTYVLVPLLGVLALGEQLRRVHVLGVALILAGVACLLGGD
jgi:drug/metabolite transporter (DMT)-like permease